MEGGGVPSQKDPVALEMRELMPGVKRHIFCIRRFILHLTGVLGWSLLKLFVSNFYSTHFLMQFDTHISNILSVFYFLAKLEENLRKRVILKSI